MENLFKKSGNDNKNGFLKQLIFMFNQVEVIKTASLSHVFILLGWNTATLYLYSKSQELQCAAIRILTLVLSILALANSITPIALGTDILSSSPQ